MSQTVIDTARKCGHTQVQDVTGKRPFDVESLTTFLQTSAARPLRNEKRHGVLAQSHTQPRQDAQKPDGTDEKVFDVEIEMPEHTIHREPYRWESVDPHASENSLLAFSMASSSRKVTVTWRWTSDGDAHTWISTVPRGR